ncbi:Gfo/Idh/MocA family oxidoreductase [Granulicella sp. WH15]|uniref:Gfo/Idh/MocA family protein n=1 Tax=Granulicella sp. WH15 TaxID=2602070 RepID=UPI0013672C26|nr:Gfo/Idh/MocA family oxidoreductase [Granulicella sp. WH15]QHN03756.1 Gfo/Idh/MocA family oxidoreductase [Granulicella sp. WH15]
MNRRDFTKLSTLALASSYLPASAQNTPTGKPVGYAAVGLGTISDIFMRGCQATQSSKITALVTGHPDTKGVKYAEMYGIPKSSIYTYEQFDRIRENKDVDAVYIGLPNSMHKEYTVRAAQAGKHVLCEKPMAVSSEECRAMIAACKKANVKLMIAYRIQYEPTWKKAIAMIEAGDIGDIQSFTGGYYAQMKAPQWRLNKALAGGGPIMDLGVYPLNAIRHITKEEPKKFTAVVSTMDHSGRFAEMEQSMEWTMEFPSGIIAKCGTSYGQSGPSMLTVNGTKGYLEFSPAFNYDKGHVGGRIGREPVDLSATQQHPYQFTLEADHFSDCVRNDKEPLAAGEEGLKDLLAIEAIYRAAGTPIA